jgi:ankyrin repeat protein
MKMFTLLASSFFGTYLLASPNACAVFATQEEDYLLMDACINYGYYPNASIDSNGNHIYHAYINTMSFEMFVHLLDKGANIYAKNREGNSILDSIDVDSDKFFYLVNRFNIFDYLDEKLHASLVIKVFKKGNRALQERIIKKRANISSQDLSGWTPLMYAIHEGNLEVITLLLNNGATVNGKIDIDAKPSIEAFFNPYNQTLIRHLEQYGIPIKKPIDCKVCINLTTTNSNAHQFITKKMVKVMQEILYLRAKNHP